MVDAGDRHHLELPVHPSAAALARRQVRDLLSRWRLDQLHETAELVVSELITGDTPKTKEALAALRRITQAKTVLVVVEEGDRLTWLSLRNVPEVHLLDAGQLNTYDVLCNEDVVFTRAAYEKVVARLGDSGKDNG